MKVVYLTDYETGLEIYWGGLPMKNCANQEMRRGWKAAKKARATVKINKQDAVDIADALRVVHLFLEKNEAAVNSGQIQEVNIEFPPDAQIDSKKKKRVELLQERLRIFLEA
jgi:hypothetical protein